MAVDIETIGIGVDTIGVTKGAKELDKLGASADKASKQADKVTASSKKQTVALDDNAKATSLLSSGVGRLAAAYISLNGAKALIRTIDEYTKFTAQLKLATRSQQEYNSALSDVKRIANTAQVSLSSIGTLYARLNNALRDLGVSQTQVAKITENVGLALKVSGATASEASSAMLQLSQAFGSGVLRGEEFNAVNEAAPALMRALAESIGVPIGQLRNLASDGQITSDVLAKAFGDDKLLETYRKQAKEIGTITGELQKLQNKWLEISGNIKPIVLPVILKITDAAGKALDIFSESYFPKDGNFKGVPFSSTFGPLGLIAQTGARLFAPLPKSGSNKKQASGAIGGSSYVSDTGNYAPNFNTTVEAQNIDEIHKAQETAAKIADEKYKKAKELAEKQRKLDEDAFDFQMSLINTWNKLEDKQQKEQYETQMKWMELEQKRANENFKAAQEANKQLEDERRKESEKTSDEISKSLADALYRGFEKGYSFLDNFVETLKNTFKTMVLQPIIKFLVDSSGLTAVLGALGSVFSGSASASSLVASSGGSGSLGSVFGGLKDIISAGNGSLVSSIENLGVFLSTGNGGLGDTLGGLIGQYSTQIANVLPYTGAFLQALSGDVKGAAFTAAGTAIGSIWGPIGGAIGGMLGGLVGSLFGGSDIPRFSSQSVTKLQGGKFTSINGTPAYDALGAEGQAQSLNEAFLTNLSTFFKEFNYDPNLSAKTEIYKKRENSAAMFSSFVDGKLLSSIGVKKSADETQQAFNALVDKVFGDVTAKTIERSGLPAGIKKFFETLTKKEDVADAMTTLVSMKNALQDLPAVFNAVKNAIDTTAYDTTIAQLKAQYEATQNFVNLFYSDTEKLDIFTQQLVTQFDKLNETIPTSRDQYRALVESINVVDEATRDQFNGLIALAPAMDEYFNLLQQQKDGINGVNAALRGSENFSNIIDFQRYQGIAANYGGSVANGNAFGTNNALVVSELQSLNLAIGRLNVQMQENNKNAKKTADLLTSVTEDGQALLTVAA